MELPQELQTERLEEEYMGWFKREFGFSPVITTSSGRPAVNFAQYVFQKYALPKGDDNAAD